MISYPSAVHITITITRHNIIHRIQAKNIHCPFRPKAFVPHNRCHPHSKLGYHTNQLSHIFKIRSNRRCHIRNRQHQTNLINSNSELVWDAEIFSKSGTGSYWVYQVRRYPFYSENDTEHDIYSSANNLIPEDIFNTLQ